MCSWCPQIPSSVFWKELALAMPRRVVYHNQSVGDPQTMLQDDKDPMLTITPDYLDCNSDTDPAGDLGKGKLSHHTLVITWHTTNLFMCPASNGAALCHSISVYVA